MTQGLPDSSQGRLKKIFKRFLIAVVFSIAFGYIEAAVVVYLRAIFYPDGFTFPLTEFGIGPLWKRLLLTEVGREAATLVLILTASYLFARARRQQVAYFLTIFAVWDISYYVWLKVLLDWPATIMDWDILFLIPVPWASPVLAPVIVSFVMLICAMVILYRCSLGKPLEAKPQDLVCLSLCAVLMIVSFCIAGLHITKPDYRSHFHWPLFAVGLAVAAALFLKRLAKSK
ncbi:MAG: hypothetical protein JSW23_03180 [Planctomycetota bacterium]|nr:MAG: hypothetical protein JSW23_03180 [Planctomycetota bacterium]